MYVYLFIYWLCVYILKGHQTDTNAHLRLSDCVPNGNSQVLNQQHLATAACNVVTTPDDVATSKSPARAHDTSPLPSCQCWNLLSQQDKPSSKGSSSFHLLLMLGRFDRRALEMGREPAAGDSWLNKWVSLSDTACNGGVDKDVSHNTTPHSLHALAFRWKPT